MRSLSQLITSDIVVVSLFFHQLAWDVAFSDAIIAIVLIIYMAPLHINYVLKEKIALKLHSKYITEKYISIDFFILTVMIVVNNR